MSFEYDRVANKSISDLYEEAMPLEEGDKKLSREKIVE